MPPLQWADSHCHLDDGQYDDDRGEMLARAEAADLKYMLSIGTGDGPPDLECAIRQAESSPSVLATVGVHPNDAPKISGDTFTNLETLIAHPKVVAIGEIGLDYYWDVPKEQQIPLFRRQLQLAAAANMPVIIHTRDAWDDTLQILREEWRGMRPPCVMHCFTGDAARAESFLELGCYLAFGGVLTFPKSAPVREAARRTPADRYLLETDAPYLAPVPYRGKRNEPAFLPHTAQVLAEVRGEPLEQIAKQSTSTFERVFLSHLSRVLPSGQPLH